jgi:hypothetical protein
MSNPIKANGFGTAINFLECAGKPYLSNRTAEVRGSIPRSSTTITSCFRCIFGFAGSPRHVRDLAGRCVKERVSETPKSETSRADSAGVKASRGPAAVRSARSEKRVKSRLRLAFFLSP